MSAAKWLRRKEWSMGNGQCPECCGMGEMIAANWKFHGMPAEYGHKDGCEFAKALEELGEQAVWAVVRP